MELIAKIASCIAGASAVGAKGAALGRTAGLIIGGVAAIFSGGKIGR